MTFFVTPRSSSISRVDGWIVAARCSTGGSGSCSNTVTDMPLRLSASAHTIPTGPAPTMTTRALAFDAAMPGESAGARCRSGRLDVLDRALPAALGHVEDDALRGLVFDLVIDVRVGFLASGDIGAARRGDLLVHLVDAVDPHAEVD